MNLFFIDDDNTYLYLLKRTCTKFKEIEAIHTAENGDDAIKKINEWLRLKSQLPNIMFVDINMPKMNGIDFLKNFKLMCKVHPQLETIKPIAMLTSSQHSSDKERCMETGIVSEYIIKPEGKKDMEKVIKHVLG